MVHTAVKFFDVWKQNKSQRNVTSVTNRYKRSNNKVKFTLYNDYSECNTTMSKSLTLKLIIYKKLLIMKTETMRAFLDATNGGLDIFRNYIKTPFTLDKMEIVKSINKRFIVSYNERYKNYVVKIEDWDGIKWTNSRNFNAVWYVKEIYELNEQQAYDKIEYDMELKITINSNDIEKNENEDLETLSDESNYREKIIQKTLKKKTQLTR